ncbi:MAG: MASE1 domain-containing protein [bacterium]
MNRRESPDRVRPFARSYLAWIAPLYLAGAILGYRFYLTPDSVAAFWPASGILLAALLLTRARWWIPIVVVSAGLDTVAELLMRHAGPITFTDFSVQLEALLGATIIRRLAGPRIDLSQFRGQLAWLAGGVVVAPALAAFLGTSSFVRVQADVAFISAWQVWYFADALGVLLLTPLVLAWFGRPDPGSAPRSSRTTESLIATLLLVLLGMRVFGGAPVPARSILDFPYLVYPILLWISLRSGPRLGSLAAVLVAVQAVWFTVQGRGPFVLSQGATTQADVIAIQSFLLVVTLSCVLLYALVSDRRRAERERLELQEQVAALGRMELVARLAGGVAHDFNNDLFVISGYLEQLTRDPRTVADADILNTIRSAVERSTNRTRELLTVGRRQSVDESSVPVATLLENVERAARSLLRGGVRLECAADPVAHVRVDRGQLEQALLNLVINARDAIDAEGTIRLTAEVRDVSRRSLPPASTLQPGPHVHIRVEDDGHGIAPEHLQRIFEPFFTTKPEDRGTGLGLASALGIVRRARGDLRVDSTVGHGTTFTILLPLECVEQPVAPNPSPGR